ncbi:MAG: toxin-antitoxin system HicB family antitoxin [Bacteroidales bacterium]|jgi:predicted transcriptional regulator|nr:toxin-antitoxin system HicB family antitoxin [Bacteroidales bacterium]MBQ1930440.1 toxin-antitoxin system HicB family antitoxin [Bacteroidales bacterium]MBQ5784322.1 toxin-antitoxin system HicB family antitoxin [Bacteroidales bacterium]
MGTTVAAKKITTFRLSEELLERLKVLAKKENRSLNNFVEYTLMEIAYNEPNEETIAAMKEAESGVELETLDVDNFRSYVKSL